MGKNKNVKSKPSEVDEVVNQNSEPNGDEAVLHGDGSGEALPPADNSEKESAGLPPLVPAVEVPNKNEQTSDSDEVPGKLKKFN